MALGMVVVLAVLIALVVWLVQQRGGAASVPVHSGMSAREALDHRLVAGEVTPSQYDELRARLEGPSGVGASPPGAPPVA